MRGDALSFFAKLFFKKAEIASPRVLPTNHNLKCLFTLTRDRGNLLNNKSDAKFKKFAFSPVFCKKRLDK